MHIVAHHLLQTLGQGIAAQSLELSQALLGCGIILKIRRECGSKL